MNEVLVQYGAIGVIALAALLAVKVMYTNLMKIFEQERARADRLEQELLQLNEAVRNEYLRTVSEATRAIAAALDAVRRG